MDDVRKLTLNLDMDGVIYDFNEAMTSWAEVTLGRKLPPTRSWEMWDAWGISKTQWFKLFHEAIEGGVFETGFEVPGATEAVQKLIFSGHRVRIVTSKKLLFPESTRRAQHQTINWLASRDLLNDVELAFTGDKSGYEADVIVDDKPTMAWAQRGALNLLFAQPWNEDVPEEAYFGPTEIVRADGWVEVLRHVHEMANPLEAPTKVSPGAGGF